jgi:uncharacterized membrane protein YoaK (UPF0700 family)
MRFVTRSILCEVIDVTMNDIRGPIPHPTAVASQQAVPLIYGWPAYLRAMICGYVDSYALLNFGVFASFMSGNTTNGGSAMGRGHLFAAGHSLLPIPFFVLGIFCGTTLAHSDQRRGLRQISALVAAMLLLCGAVAFLHWPD